VIVAKSRRLEVRQLRTSQDDDDDNNDDDDDDEQANSNVLPSPFPVVLTVPINGRITSLQSIQIPTHPTALLFLTTDQYQYAVISYNGSASASASSHPPPNATTNTNPHNPYPIVTHASGSLQGEEWNILGQPAESGPLVAVDPHNRCIVLHIYNGLLTIFPIHFHSSNHPHTNSKTTGQKASSGSNRASFLPTSGSSSGSSILGLPFHVRMEERTVLSLTMLHHPMEHGNSSSTTPPPHVCLLHQDSRGAQHITTHCIDLKKSQIWFAGNNSHGGGGSGGGGGLGGAAPATCEWLKKSRIDGGSSLLIPVAPRPVAAAAAAASASSSHATGTQPPAPSGGVIILGQRQITFCALHHYKVMPIPPALILSWDVLPPDTSGMPRYLLGDEFGNIHMLTLITDSNSGQRVIALQLDTLGSCTLSSSLEYLNHGIVFCGSTLGDSQLVQIHDEPIPVQEDDPDGDDALELGDTTYLSVVEEYTHLGPIVDFDLLPTTPGGGGGGGGAGASSATASGTTANNNNAATTYGQSQVVTASGSSKSGSLRIVRNGIGMNEYASVELSGIQNMWSLRKAFEDEQDAYLVQSFVGETRVLGVVVASSTAAAAAAAGEDSVMKDDSQDKDEDGEEEVGGSLEEVLLPGLESNASTLYVGNVIGNLFLQITESQLRLASNEGQVLDMWEPPKEDSSSSPITVAAANEAGQVVVALRGGLVVYFEISNGTFQEICKQQMDREVSCMDLNPFTSAASSSSSVSVTTAASSSDMDVEGGSSSSKKQRVTYKSDLVAVGLWDDFTVRLLSLETSNPLMEWLRIHLSTEQEEEDHEDGITAQGQRRNRNNMMARSLCLCTLDFSSSSSNSTKSNHHHHHNSSPGVNMLFVGLGDGTLVSFAVVQPGDGRAVTVQSKKEVSLGTQRINLIPLHTERGGTCVLATGDRPTVIYLAGIGGASSTTSVNFNPKLCYSNVNLSPAEEELGTDVANDVSRPHAQQSIAVNVAAPFFSPLLFDAMANQHYSLCVADDTCLRLGVIDDIQKLHVTTCRLGMAPRRIVHCPEGRLFAVGCIESGIKQLGMGGTESNLGNCIRFLDDTTFDDIERYVRSGRVVVVVVVVVA
jgi:DNA damage-binding protein 1